MVEELWFMVAVAVEKREGEENWRKSKVKYFPKYLMLSLGFRLLEDQR